MKLNAKVTGMAREGDRGVVFSGDVEGGGWLFKLPNTEGYALDQELTLLVLTEYDAANFYHWLGGLRNRSINETAERITDQLRPDPPPPWEGDRPRCVFVCMARDDVGSIDHQCLLPHGHTEPHTYSASCLLQRVQQPDTADTQEFRLGGTA